MDIPFRASERASLGVEVELGIVNRRTRELTPAATLLLDRLGGEHPEGEHPKVKHELFLCTVELITGICATVAEARSDLEVTLDAVCEVADELGMALVGSGTHPTSHWSAQVISPHPRYHELVDRIQWPARRLAIHGVHYHVGVRSGEKAIAIANSVAFHLPLFLALTASSPYWHGLDTGMASCRTKVFEGLPTAGLPPHLTGWRDFEAFMGALVTAQAIETVREVWWDVRPHPDFGTVELRMCDCPSNLTEVAAVAALAQSLVQSLDERLDRGEALPVGPDWVLRQNKWSAARFGLEAQVIVNDDGTLRPVTDVIRDLVRDLTPVARGLGCEKELNDVGRILDVGPGYHRQRRVVEQGGTLTDVVDLLIAELAAGEPSS